MASFLEALATDPASWAQAFAALVALLIGVWAVLREGHAERRRDRLQRTSVAVATLPSIHRVKIEAENVGRTLALFRREAGNLMGKDVSGDIARQEINLPSMVERNLDRFYLLEEPAGPACLQLASLIMQYNDALDQMTATVLPRMHGGQWGESVEHLEENAALIVAVADKCISLLTPISDAVKG